MELLKPPFPWFGGKAKVASVVWSALGDVKNYVEPFFGAGAVLLGRPHEARIETVNDLDGFVANFWRSTQWAPSEVVEWASWPVNENDLHGRHGWLVEQREDLAARLEGNPAFYDSMIAGWWLWGICAWIGGGWCSGRGPWRSVDGKLTNDSPGGISRSLPRISRVGMEGIWRARPQLSSPTGCGVEHKRPLLGGRGRGAGVHSMTTGECGERMEALRDRLRFVRVCCGDWSRVRSPAVTTEHGLTGMFLDPPYGSDLRDSKLYPTDVAGSDPAAECGEWCVENGEDPLLRIALCGYEGEHDHLEGRGWRVFAWKTQGGYANRGESRGRANKARERIWFSPHCLTESASIEDMPIFAGSAIAGNGEGEK